MTEYYNLNKTLSITIPNITEDVIALSMSGGADSAILCYLFAKEIHDNKLTSKILPFTRYRPYPKENPMNWNVRRVNDIVNCISNIYSTEIFEKHWVEYPPDNMQEKMDSTQEHNYVTELHDKINKFITDQGKTWTFYYGVTANPSKQDMLENDLYYEYRVKDRDQELKREKMRSRPFDLVDKKFIKELYEQFNLLDVLFPLTYSCEGHWTSNNNYTCHCKECWWCKERFWAFGRYE